MRLPFAAIILLGLVAIQTPAHAQETSQTPASYYAFEGLTFSRINGPLRARASEVLQLQVGLGYQPQNSLWAYELMGRGGGTIDANSSGASLLGWGLRAKRFVPIHPHIHLYGRAGVTENLLTDSPGANLAGFGLEYGAGAMASLRVRALGFLFWPAFFMGVGPKVNLSVWADLGGEVGNLHASHKRGAENYDYRASSASYGLTVGGRF